MDMKKSFLLLSLAAAVAGCCTAKGPKDSGTTFARDALQPYVDSGELPGAVNVFYKDGVQETCAIGYADACFDIDKVDVDFTSAAGRIAVCRSGAGVPFSEEEAKKILLEKDIGIEVSLNQGDASATAWGCDLTYDYVKINGDYRT